MNPTDFRDSVNNLRIYVDDQINYLLGELSHMEQPAVQDDGVREYPGPSGQAYLKTVPPTEDYPFTGFILGHPAFGEMGFKCADGLAEQMIQLVREREEAVDRRNELKADIDAMRDKLGG